MPAYDIALIVTVEAVDYPTALAEAEDIAAGVGDDGINISAVIDYEHDNEGQRVLYLPPTEEELAMLEDWGMRVDPEVDNA